MRILRLIILSFLFLFILVTGISLFIPSHVRISRAINVGAPPAAVMPTLENPVRWKEWYPGVDSAALYYENGVAKGVNLSPDGKVRLVLRGKKGNEVITEFRSSMRPVVNGWNVISHPGSDSTTVQWYMDFHLRWYPWEKFTSIMFDRWYGPKMEKGLENIRNLSSGSRSSQ